ncbi:MAG: F0F1 ATP synthase subunit epsilon [Deltaproteobacteria bacterium]|jgi:F-type H+-transporting ATPase subunit epsilon|nr:F0F1 ATP synthase subunit epsilon [Deltaproteobacteria bacterium]
MSEKKFIFTLVTPEGRMVDPVEVVSVTAFGEEGAFTALPGHTPFLTPLKETGEGGSVVKYRTAAGDGDEIYVDAGVIEVLPDRVTVLAESAEDWDTMLANREKAEKAAEELKKLLEAAQKQTDDFVKGIGGVGKLPDIGELEVQLIRATGRLKHIDKARKRNA